MNFKNSLPNQQNHRKGKLSSHEARSVISSASLILKHITSLLDDEIFQAPRREYFNLSGKLFNSLRNIHYVVIP